jgi:hypothetical protein
MTNPNAAQAQRNFNKFSVWLQRPEAAWLCEQQAALIQHYFAALLTGPQLGLVNCDERFSAVLESVPGFVQRISCDSFVNQRNVDFPAASLNSIVVPFALSFMGTNCEAVNWRQLNHLLAPGGQLLVTGVNPSPPASSFSKTSPPDVATRSSSSVTKALMAQDFHVSKSIFHGFSSRTTIPSIYCSRYPIFSPLFVHWAILYKQSKPTGTLVGRLKSSPRKQVNTAGNNRQS